VDITPSEAYQLFLDDPDSFKSSAASPKDCLAAFTKASKRAHNIVCITVSKGLSMMYDAACEAKEMALTELPDTIIQIIDSKTASPAEGMVALAAARSAAEGKDLNDVTFTAETVKNKVDVIIALDTIQHVYRSGRIPKIASQIGSALNIKPIFTVSEVVHFNGIVRSREQGTKRMLQIMIDKVGSRPVHVAVTHAYALDEAEKLRDRIAAEFNCVELWLSEFSPVMGYACGTGTVGIAYYPED
jgi:DegV family protein with EDD domain